MFKRKPTGPAEEAYDLPLVFRYRYGVQRVGTKFRWVVWLIPFRGARQLEGAVIRRGEAHNRTHARHQAETAINEHRGENALTEKMEWSNYL